MREQGSGSSPVTFCRLTSVCSTTTDRLQASDQVRSLQHNTVVHFQWPRHLHNQIQPCIVQPPWSRPWYSQYGLLHCTKQIQPFLYNFPQSRHYGFQRLTAGHYCTAWHSRPLRPLYSHYGFPRHTAGHCGLVIVRPGTVGHKDLASVQQSMAVNNKALGKPYSEHALAAPGSEARSDLTCTSLQYLATEPGLQALSDLTCTSLQCLATEPGLSGLCEHVQAAPGSKARSDFTCTCLQCLAGYLWSRPYAPPLQQDIQQDISGPAGYLWCRQNAPPLQQDPNDEG